MDLEELEQKLAARLGDADGVPAGVIVLDFGADGAIRIDTTVRPPAVSGGGGAADCRLALSRADFAAIVKGELDPQTAYFTGRLRIEGSIGLAMQLGGLLRA